MQEKTGAEVKQIEYKASYVDHDGFPKTFANVIADGFISDAQGRILPIRWLHLADGRRVEIPMTGSTVVVFSKVRLTSIAQREEVERQRMRAKQGQEPPQTDRIPSVPKGETVQ